MPMKLVLSNQCLSVPHSQNDVALSFVGRPIQVSRLLKIDAALMHLSIVLTLIFSPVAQTRHCLEVQHFSCSEKTLNLKANFQQITVKLPSLPAFQLNFNSCLINLNHETLWSLLYRTVSKWRWYMPWHFSECQHLAANPNPALILIWRIYCVRFLIWVLELMGFRVHGSIWAKQSYISYHLDIVLVFLLNCRVLESSLAPE